MPDASTKSTNHRAVLAGFGTTASLTGAATVAALVVTGLVAFSGWPDGAIRQAPAPVRLADPAPSGDQDVALATPAAPSAAPEGSATTVAGPGNTPTPVPGSDVAGQAGTGNVPVAAAAAPSPQSPAGTSATPDPAIRTTDVVADATVAAGNEVGRGVQAAAGTAEGTTGELLPRTTAVVAAAVAGAGQSTGGAAEAVSEIIRTLPVGATRRKP